MPAISRVDLSRILSRLAIALVCFASWFGVAGRIGWPQGWMFLTVFLGFTVTFSWHLAHTDPALFHERVSQSSDIAESWDRTVMRLYLVLVLVLMVVAALDSGRFRWSVVPPWAQLIGWILSVMCGIVVWHVSTKNTYLSRYARIQNDRAQVVVRDGLYSHVRHPMYLSMILLFCGLPLVFGSWYSYMPSLAIVSLVIYRTHREDQMLQEGLAGYTDYARDVRYRLVPGLW